MGKELPFIGLLGLHLRMGYNGWGNSPIKKEDLLGLAELRLGGRNWVGNKELGGWNFPGINLFFKLGRKELYFLKEGLRIGRFGKEGIGYY